jgi:glyoxylase-like metal-dependent hydrolase (beta-lactamase superfamily II)
MLRERVSNDIYIFTSEVYVQVTAGVIVTPEGAIIIDTLPIPSESREMARFVRQKCPQGVKYVILTHYHADHTFGAYLYPKAHVIGHDRCRELLATKGEAALQTAKEDAQELEEISIRLPDVTLDQDELDVHLGNKTLRLLRTPGHAEDVLAAFLEEDLVLFASDTVMPVPTIIDGDLEILKDSLRRLMDLGAESIVRGHGEVILRGEVKSTIQQNIDYLDRIWKIAQNAVEEGARDSLRGKSIEECGLSRVALDGRAQQFHAANLFTLYDQIATRRD